MKTAEKTLLKEKKEITKLSKMQNRSSGSKYFLVLLMLIAVVNIITKGKVIKKKEFSCAGCPSAGVCNGGCASKKEGE